MRYVEELASLTLVARAIDAAGDSVPDAEIVWELLDADTGFDLDSIAGTIQALSPGSGRVRARVEGLRSDTISVVVTGAPDSIAVNGESRIEIDPSAVDFSALQILLYDLTTEPGSTLPAAGKEVAFSLISPDPSSDEAQLFFLTEEATAQGIDPFVLMTTTDESGSASAVLRFDTGTTLPDSAVVEAAATTAVGANVPGSPLRFTVVFQQAP